MEFFTDLAKSVNEALDQVSKEMREPVEFSDYGVSSFVYLPIEQDTDAIQLQDGNKLAVIKFLVDHGQPFFYCSHGHLHLIFDGEVEDLEIGEWVTSTVVDGEFDVYVMSNKAFVRDFGLKKAEPTEEELLEEAKDLERKRQTKATPGITIDVEEMNRVSDTAVDSPKLGMKNGPRFKPVLDEDDDEF